MPTLWQLCGSQSGNIHRDYLDVICRGDAAALITVSLEFRKRKCEGPGCGCVYYSDFSFASPYARTTRRLDNTVVHVVLRGGCSYAEVPEELEDKLSHQVVGQLFHRRVKELNMDLSEDAT